MLEQLQSAVTFLFGGDTPIGELEHHQVALRAMAIYVAGVAIVRVGKSRLISRATPLDVILGFILGSLLSRGITGSASMTDTFIASAVLVALHWLFTLVAYHSPWFENLIKGHSYPLIDNGRKCPAGMKRSHVSSEDLAEAMRQHGVENPADVIYAYKERNGEVSIIERSKERERHHTPAHVDGEA